MELKLELCCDLWESRALDSRLESALVCVILCVLEFLRSQWGLMTGGTVIITQSGVESDFM